LGIGGFSLICIRPDHFPGLSAGVRPAAQAGQIDIRSETIPMPNVISTLRPVIRPNDPLPLAKTIIRGDEGGY
jgi:hypothetical protein